MYYTINVSLNGKHFLSTSEHSIPDIFTLKKVYSELVEAFPSSKGYNVDVTYWKKIGKTIDMDKLEVDDAD